MEVKGATLQTVRRWVARANASSTSRWTADRRRCTLGEDGDVGSTQGDAHIHADRRGSVKTAVPDGLVGGHDASV
jgi:hypothetical protein